MPVMGEVDDLRALGHLCQHLQCGRTALVVELHQQIVDDHRHRFTFLEPRLDRRDAQREKQLMPRPLAQRVDRQTATVGAFCQQDLTGFVVIGDQPGERTEGDRREHLRRPAQQRPLVSVPVDADHPIEHS